MTKMDGSFFIKNAFKVLTVSPDGLLNRSFRVTTLYNYMNKLMNLRNISVNVMTVKVEVSNRRDDCPA